MTEGATAPTTTNQNSKELCETAEKLSEDSPEAFDELWDSIIGFYKGSITMADFAQSMMDTLSAIENEVKN